MNNMEKWLEQMDGHNAIYHEPPKTLDGQDTTPREFGVPERYHVDPGQVPMTVGHIALNPDVVDRPPSVKG